ncbi:hypothetical protein [Chengkuizengella marina]|uniref:Uncharacterized protein n=1 Tax=Chengkuizengella marina TaxID=2507566 RepID=A0A6N9Q6T4_9BACL|nr:hypothetical protein [Chengkuizengella marina]NBI30566.1 hypothetical protein [Chengkuizengella marina]
MNNKLEKLEENLYDSLIKISVALRPGSLLLHDEIESMFNLIEEITKINSNGSMLKRRFAGNLLSTYTDIVSQAIYNTTAKKLNEKLTKHKYEMLLYLKKYEEITLKGLSYNDTMGKDSDLFQSQSIQLDKKSLYDALFDINNMEYHDFNTILNKIKNANLKILNSIIQLEGKIYISKKIAYELFCYQKNIFWFAIAIEKDLFWSDLEDEKGIISDIFPKHISLDQFNELFDTYNDLILIIVDIYFRKGFIQL